MVAVILSACGSHGGGESSSPDGGSRANAPGIEASWTGLSLELEPDPAQGELGVEISLTGVAAATVSQLSVARAWAGTHGVDAVRSFEIRDGEGAVPVSPGEDDAEDRRFTLRRRAVGETLRLRYRARADLSPSRFGLHLGGDRLSGVGHAFLLLPRIDAPLPVRVRWKLGRLAAGAGAASSFGAGEEVLTQASSEELAHAVYLAGPLRVEAPRAMAEGDAGPPVASSQLAVLGAPVFDTRAAFYWSTTAFAEVTRFLGAPEAAPSPFWFLLVPTPALGGDHDGAYLHRSFGLWFDAARSFDAGLKSVVAHELTHRFVGGGVRLLDAQGREAIWFSEGFTVHLARRMLLESGMVSPRDLLGDLRRTTGEGAEGGEAACAEERRGRAEEYRQGARYAATVDAALQKKSAGKRGLPDLVRALLDRAKREGTEAFPVADWRALVVSELGAQAGADFDHQVLGGAPIALTDGIFGPCFARVEREEAVFELGFDRAGLEGSVGMVRGLVPGSAAEKAGLREGALVTSARVPEAMPIPPGGKGVPEVELTLGKGKRVRYRPIGARRVGTWELRACSARR